MVTALLAAVLGATLEMNGLDSSIQFIGVKAGPGSTSIASISARCGEADAPAVRHMWREGQNISFQLIHVPTTCVNLPSSHPCVPHHPSDKPRWSIKYANASLESVLEGPFTPTAEWVVKDDVRIGLQATLEAALPSASTIATLFPNHLDGGSVEVTISVIFGAGQPYELTLPWAGDEGDNALLIEIPAPPPPGSPPLAPSPASPPASPPSSPAPLLVQHLFKVCPAHCHWATASQECKNGGGELVSIHSDADQNAVTEFVQNNDYNSDHPWIGGDCIVGACSGTGGTALQNFQGCCTWLDGTPFDYTFNGWATSDVDDQGKMHVYRNGAMAWGTWGDSGGDTSEGICKYT